jgi:hypothetical protein
LPTLQAPTEPQFEDVCPQIDGNTDPITLIDLNANQLSRFNFLISQFNIKEKKYYAKKALIDDMRHQIQQTVQVEHFVYTTGCETTYDVLVNLKTRFEPSTTIRERQLIREYNALKQLDSTTQIEPWLMKWDVIVRKCQRISLPEAQGSRPAFDFIESIQDRFPTFFSIWQIRLIEEEDHTHTTELFKLVQTFRDHLKSLKPTATRGKHTAFATFQDIQEGSSEQGNSTSQSNQQSRATVLTPRQSAQSVSLGGGWKEVEELGIQSDGDEKDGSTRYGAIKYRTYQPTPQLSRSQCLSQ